MAADDDLEQLIEAPFKKANASSAPRAAQSASPRGSPEQDEKRDRETSQRPSDDEGTRGSKRKRSRSRERHREKRGEHGDKDHHRRSSRRESRERKPEGESSRSKRRSRSRSRSRGKDRGKGDDERSSHHTSSRSDRKDREHHRSDKDRHLERERSRDEDRHREKVKEQEEEPRTGEQDVASEKDQDRGHDRERSHRRRSSREKERERDGERPRERERDSERDREHRRRSSRDREHRHDDYERSRRSSRDAGRRDGRRSDERNRSRERDYGPSSRGGQSKRPASPVLNEIERDKRTVFCMQLAARLREKELLAFMEQAGRVRDARIITDRISGRSKGVGYVEYYEESSVPAAIALTGQKLLGIPIVVTLTESEKNRLAEAEKAAQSSAPTGKGDVNSRIYVGNVHVNLGDEHLRQVFEPFGPIDSISLHPPQEGRTNGYAFVQFRNSDDAKLALQQMNGFELGGRVLKVSNVTSSERTQGSAMPSHQSLSIDEGETNFAMNAQTRTELMMKLAARSSSDLFPTQKPKPGSPAPPAVQPSTKAILLTNMFDPAEETEPEWDQEIAEDVGSEAGKYGRVTKLRVDKESQGHVYILFDSVESAQGAITALNGRLFAGKRVAASFVPEGTV